MRRRALRVRRDDRAETISFFNLFSKVERIRTKLLAAIVVLNECGIEDVVAR